MYIHTHIYVYIYIHTRVPVKKYTDAMIMRIKFTYITCKCVSLKHF